MSERARFCEGCPRVPAEIVAEVEEIEFMDRARLKLSTPAREFIMSVNGLDPQSVGYRDPETLVARIGTEAVEVDGNGDGIKIGDKGELFVVAGTVTRAELQDRIVKCDKPGIKKRRFAADEVTCEAIPEENVLDL